MAARYALNLDGGTTFRRTIRPFHESDGVRTPWDLTGMTFLLVVKDSEERFRDSGCTDVASFDLTVNNSEIEIHLTPDDVEQFTGVHRRYHYVINATLANGDVTRLLEGPINVDGGCSP